MWKPFQKFLGEIGVNERDIGSVIVALGARRGDYVEVYAPPSRELLKAAIGIGVDNIYSMGLYVGMMAPRKWFKPSLPLAHKLAPLCKSKAKCVAVDEAGERFFLYGRSVLGERVPGWKPGLVLVLNRRGEALGWGRGIIANIGGVKRRLLEPVWDLGWYLRRGG